MAKKFFTKTAAKLDSNNNIVGIQVDTEKESFVVPIVDVRRDRGRVEGILKAGNIHRGSKFLQPSYSVDGHRY